MKISMPFFSLVVPIYNTSKYLKACIDSILSQVFFDFEIILVNDGSTDNSDEICRSYLLDERIIYFEKENGGLSDARNYGIERCKGEYIVFVDSDDYYDCDFLSELRDFIKGEDIIVINHLKEYPDGKRRVYGCNKNLPKEELDFFILNLYKACAWDKVIRRSFLLNNDLFFEKGLLSEDILWCGRILSCQPKMCFYPKPVYVYRQRYNSISKTVKPKHIDDIFYMIDKLLKENNSNLLPYFLSFEYSSLLFNIAKFDKATRKKYKKKYKQNDFLLSFASSKKPKIVRFFYKIFGYNVCCLALRFFAWLKHA